MPNSLTTEYDDTYREGEPFTIRNFRLGDESAASRLYREGLLIGQLDPFDQATDLERIDGNRTAKPITLN